MKWRGGCRSITSNLSHPARGAWIEIGVSNKKPPAKRSHPARGAWIEISVTATKRTMDLSRTPHGVRGLKCAHLIGLRAGEGRTPHGVRGLKCLHA